VMKNVETETTAAARLTTDESGRLSRKNVLQGALHARKILNYFQSTNYFLTYDY